MLLIQSGWADSIGFELLINIQMEPKEARRTLSFLAIKILILHVKNKKQKKYGGMIMM